MIYMMRLECGMPQEFIAAESREDGALFLIRRSPNNGGVAHKITNPEFVVPEQFYQLSKSPMEDRPNDGWWIWATGGSLSDDDDDEEI